MARNPQSRFRNAAARTFFGYRDRAIVGVQVSTGLRISETFGLRLQDYSAERATLTVAQSKSGRLRAVPVGDSLARLLAEWLSVRPQASPTDFLFVTEYGGQLHRDTWGRQSQRYLEFARSQGHALPRITLHSLRDLAGTARAEHDLYHASLILGYSSIKVTADNYLHARAEGIRAITRQPTHWPRSCREDGKHQSSATNWCDGHVIQLLVLTALKSCPMA